MQTPHFFLHLCKYWNRIYVSAATALPGHIHECAARCTLEQQAFTCRCDARRKVLFFGTGTQTSLRYAFSGSRTCSSLRCRKRDKCLRKTLPKMKYAATASLCGALLQPNLNRRSRVVAHRRAGGMATYCLLAKPASARVPEYLPHNKKWCRAAPCAARLDLRLLKSVVDIFPRVQRSIVVNTRGRPLFSS